MSGLGAECEPRRLAVPAVILADPPVMCPSCGSGRVLSELSAMTCGRCYDCFVVGAELQHDAR